MLNRPSSKYNSNSNFHLLNFLMVIQLSSAMFIPGYRQQLMMVLSLCANNFI
ncbi:hypothetical protein MuYL_1618 [Mucilaginibacter xinganensis]|uniref:Uncharacterized protein n=1 Tax=Mucilaginibacter xinganensis TaxID=1234841 RepID=A0A223NUK5_9SPHI|nr:hypothetical protein MuYL_1618 [Mucilaginibacter xinganensis]